MWWGGGGLFGRALQECLVFFDTHGIQTDRETDSYVRV